MLNKMKNYYKNKPTQAVLMLVVFIWSVYEIGATSLASNSALTKEFMHSRYVIVWPMVDKKVKLYHYAEGTLSEAYFSTLDAKYYLISENATIVEKKLGKNIEDLIQEIELVREEFSSVLTRMKILRLVYLILRMIVLLQCIKWSGQRRKRKENEILQNR